MKQKSNIIFLIIGIILLIVEFKFLLDGTVGFLLTTFGVLLIGLAFFKGNNPFKVVFNLISNFL